MKVGLYKCMWVWMDDCVCVLERDVACCVSMSCRVCMRVYVVGWVCMPTRVCVCLRLGVFVLGWVCMNERGREARAVCRESISFGTDEGEEIVF